MDRFSPGWGWGAWGLSSGLPSTLNAPAFKEEFLTPAFKEEFLTEILTNCVITGIPRLHQQSVGPLQDR